MRRIVPNLLWASLMAAIAAAACFFAWFDPERLLSAGNPDERMEVYTQGFFFFWLFCALSGGLALLMNLPGRRDSLIRPSDSSRSPPPAP